MTPKEFKAKYQLTVKEIADLLELSEDTLSHWLASERANRYSKPSDFICQCFGYVAANLNQYLPEQLEQPEQSEQIKPTLRTLVEHARNVRNVRNTENNRGGYGW